MRNRTLGTTGYDVSEIGYGAWGLGADMWLGADDREGSDALREALNAGVTFFDTALAYGSGHSERLIGKVLREAIHDGRAVVATKVPPRNLQWPADGDKPLTDVFPARHIAASTESSLKNLGVDALPLQQLHVWHDNWLDDSKWAASYEQMVRLTEQGKVLHWGISINDHAPETALRALRDPLFASAQVIYNIFDRSPEKDLFQLAREKNLGIIVRVPFDEGTLTGTIRADTKFPEGDWRHRYFRGDRPAEAARRADALMPLLGAEAHNLPELALRFVLTRPEVSTVIPGMRKAAHARANAAVSDGRLLDPALLEKLKGHAWAKNWYRD
jgi:aryl-alcohol dehydrogenase-like predicted oxidoreductase